jgi:hypothetical protein
MSRVAARTDAPVVQLRSSYLFAPVDLDDVALEFCVPASGRFSLRAPVQLRDRRVQVLVAEAQLDHDRAMDAVAVGARLEAEVGESSRPQGLGEGDRAGPVPGLVPGRQTEPVAAIGRGVPPRGCERWRVRSSGSWTMGPPPEDLPAHRAGPGMAECGKGLLTGRREEPGDRTVS